MTKVYYSHSMKIYGKEREFITLTIMNETNYQIKATQQLLKYLKHFIKPLDIDQESAIVKGKEIFIDPKLRRVFNDLNYIIRNEGKN